MKRNNSLLLVGSAVLMCSACTMYACLILDIEPCSTGSATVPQNGCNSGDPVGMPEIDNTQSYDAENVNVANVTYLQSGNPEIFSGWNSMSDFTSTTYNGNFPCLTYTFTGYSGPNCTGNVTSQGGSSTYWDTVTTYAPNGPEDCLPN